MMGRDVGKTKVILARGESEAKGQQSEGNMRLEGESESTEEITRNTTMTKMKRPDREKKDLERRYCNR